MFVEIIRRKLKNTALRRAIVAWRHFGLKPSDCFLASYPKSGNTWVKFVLATICAKCSVEAWSDRNQFVPTVGHQREAMAVLANGGRLLKTHESYRSTYKKAIFLVRDPRDVCVSYFHHARREMGSSDTFGQFLTRFLQGQIDAYGSWESHTQSWVQAAASMNAEILPVRYEDLLVNPLDQFRKICTFLGLRVHDDELISAIDDNRPDRMRDKEKQSPDRALFPAQNQSFVRSAKANDWRTTFSADDLAILQSHFSWASQFISNSDAGFDVKSAIARTAESQRFPRHQVDKT